jgi:hypothetical protein
MKDNNLFWILVQRHFSRRPLYQIAGRLSDIARDIARLPSTAQIKTTYAKQRRSQEVISICLCGVAPVLCAGV